MAAHEADGPTIAIVAALKALIATHPDKAAFEKAFAATFEALAPADNASGPWLTRREEAEAIRRLIIGE